MNRKKSIKTILIASLFFLALGGWLLHLRIHPVARDAENVIPFISGIVSVLCLPVLFWFGPTVNLAYILNGFLVIVGTIIMAHFSIVTFKAPLTPVSIVLNSTLADIAILWGKFAVGKAIFDLRSLRSDNDATLKGRFFRYPNMGWWWVHLFGFAAVYTLGNVFWK